MDELEKLFQDNKSSFDRLKPSKSSWDTRSNPKSLINSDRNSWLKIAASILVLLGITLTWYANQPSQFKNLTMLSPEGKEVILDPSANKYTLIQFWASGNVLCDKENCYYYLPAYKKYKDRGFEIYAISLDVDKEEWVKGIEENDLPWIHVSDLKGWESPICIECDISKLPTTFLLNQKGDIILEDLNAEILDETLGKLLATN